MEKMGVACRFLWDKFLKASLLANEPSLIILGGDGRVFKARVRLPAPGSQYFLSQRLPVAMSPVLANE